MQAPLGDFMHNIRELGPGQMHHPIRGNYPVAG